MKTKNISTWVVGRLSELEQFIEKSRFLVVSLIFLVGFSVRIFPLARSGFPVELPYGYSSLYYHFAETILENNFVFPRIIQYYSDGGIPFAYPPLPFYLMAFIARFTPLSTFILSNYLPTLMSIVTVVAFYFLAKEIFKEKKLILFSTLAYALLPTAFAQLIPGEGLSESFGVLIFITGMIFMYKMFSTNSRKQMIITGFLFGIATVGSPGGAYAFAVSLLVFSFLKGPGIFDVKKFAGVALIGALVSSPWWLTIIGYHGIDVLVNGFMVKQSNILELLTSALYFNVFGGPLWATFCLIGIFYCTIKRDFLLPIWFISFLILGEIQYIIPIPGAVLITLGLLKVVMPGFEKGILRISNIPKLLTATFLILVILHGVGLAYWTANSIRYEMLCVTKSEIETMEWIKENTEKDSIFFVVQGEKCINWHGSVEWFPAIAHRTVLNAIFGSEWAGDFKQVIRMNEDVRKATEPGHFIDIGNKYNVEFTHVYVTKCRSNAYLVSSLEESEMFELVFENQDAITFAR
ncbi:ArnT family glycosyltransferase [Chloroflexota bacterium]